MIRILENTSDIELAELYRQCAFFCMPSLYEGFGLPLLEALCYQKFALASDLGCFREIGGENARYLPARDTEAWSRAISETVALHRENRLVRPSFPCEVWSWERTARIHREAFEEVLTA